MSIIHLAQTLADDNGPPAAFLATFGLIFCGAILIGLAIQAVICFIIIKLFNRVPKEHQKQNPSMVWLMMIPLFNLVWCFFIYPKLSQSYESWAKSLGRSDIGNAGGGLALALCICIATTIIPYLNSCTGLVALVLLIIYLVQINGLADKINGGVPPANPTPSI